MKKTSYTVLVIEDEPDIRETLVYNFQKENFEVNSSGKGLKGLEDIKVTKPDVLILFFLLILFYFCSISVEKTSS